MSTTERPRWKMIGLYVPRDLDGGPILKVYRCTGCGAQIQVSATEHPPTHNCTQQGEHNQGVQTT